MTVFDDYTTLKKTGLPQLTVLFGEAADIIEELRDRLFELVHFDATDLSQAYFDLADAATDRDAALEELETLPFFGDHRLVIFENLLNITTAKKSVLDERQLARLATFLDKPLPTTQLLIICHGKLDARLKLVKKLKKTAQLLEATELKGPDLRRVFAQEKLPNPVLNRLLEKSNFQYGPAKQAIALLRTYTAGRAITPDDVEKVVPKSLQDNIFELTDLVFKHQTQAARELVHDLTLQGEDVIKLLAVLSNTFRLYYQVKLLQGKGWPEPQQTSFLKIHPYRVKLANATVRSLSADSLRQALRELITLDYQIKTSLADKNYLFDLLLIRLSTA